MNTLETLYSIFSTSIVFVALSLGIALLGILYYLWQRQKRLNLKQNDRMNFTKQLLQKTEEERQRISTNLHDSISHELLTLKNILQNDIYSANNKIDTIINDVRNISRNLHPVLFEQIGLVSTIDVLVDSLQNQNDFMVTTEVNYQPTLPSTDELQLYRIIQEALSNSIKYANAYAAKVTLNNTEQQLFLEIRDNGKGFDVSKILSTGKAFGLLSIIERSRAIGGKACLYSSNKGTIITIIIPHKN